MKANKEMNLFLFIFKVCMTLVDGVTLLGLIVIFFVCLPFVKLAIAMTNLHQCNANSKLPVWLLVFSVVMFAHGLSLLAYKIFDMVKTYEYMVMMLLWGAYGKLIIIQIMILIIFLLCVDFF